jgi:hypothetical protein
MRLHRSGHLPLASLRALSCSCLLLLGAWACSSDDATRIAGANTATEAALGELGTLALALSNNDGIDEIRLIGTLNVRDTAGAVAATVLATADSPAVQSVTLQPGLYTVELLDGFSCTHTGSTPNFSGCSFVGATPNPFEVRGGEQTAVTLEINAQFSRGQEVTTLLRTGSAQFSLLPNTAVTVLCGNGPACVAPQICAGLDGGGPTCRTPCTSSTDCAGLDCISVFAAVPPPAGATAPSGVCAN